MFFRTDLQKRNIIQFLKFIDKKLYIFYGLSGILICLTYILSYQIPILQKEFIDQSIDEKAISFYKFKLLTITYLAYLLIEYFSSYLSQLNSNRLHSYLFTKYFYNILKLPQNVISSEGAGYYYTILSHDIPNAGRIMSTIFFSFLLSLIRNIFIFILIFSWDKILGIIGILSFSISLILSIYYRKTQKYYLNEMRNKGGDLANKTTEIFSNSYIISIFNRISYVLKNIEKKQIGFRNTLNNKARNDCNISSLYSIIEYLTILSALLFSLMRIVKGDMQYGTLIALLSYFNLITTPIDSFLGILNTITASEIGISKLINIDNQINRENKRVKSTYVIPIENENNIKISNLSHEYNDSQNKLSLNIEFPQGKKTAIVGMSGEGKSTIVNIITGALKPQKGGIFFNNYNISNVPLGWYINKLNIYSQTKQFFNANLEYNINLGREMIDQEEYQNIRCELDDSIKLLFDKLTQIINCRCSDKRIERKIIKTLRSNRSFDDLFMAIYLNEYAINEDKDLILYVKRILERKEELYPYLIRFQQNADYLEKNKYNEIKDLLSLDNLLDRNLGFQGAFISGGEKEKISLFRFLLKQDEHFFILDEPFTNMDSITESKCLTILKERLENQTGLIISHKLSIVKQLADNIIVIDDGKVIESGSHKDLINNNGLYSKLYKQYIEQTK